MTGRHETDHRHGGRVKNPRAVVVVALLIVLAWLGIGGLGGQSVGKLSQVQKNDSSEFLPLSAESRQVQQTAKEFTGSQALPLIVVATAEDGSILTPDALTALGRLATDLPGLAVEGGSATVADYLTAPSVPMIPSEDGKAAMLVLSLDRPSPQRPTAPGSAPWDRSRPWWGTRPTRLRRKLASRHTSPARRAMSRTSSRPLPASTASCSA